MKLVCFCNKVSRDTVHGAIQNGARKLQDIFDQTGAGVGPCGGTCRPLLMRELQAEELSAQDASVFEMAPELVEAISLFNRRYYWEAHEVLEGAWLNAPSPLREFYQGLIKAFAAFYQVLNLNPRSVLKLSAESRAQLATFAPEYAGIKLALLLDCLQRFEGEAREILARAKPGFDYDSLPRISTRFDAES